MDLYDWKKMFGPTRNIISKNIFRAFFDIQILKYKLNYICKNKKI